jgi:hypothetical protein
MVERHLKNDWTFSYVGKTYQIPRQNIYPPTKSKIQIKIILSGRIIAYYRWTDIYVREQDKFPTEIAPGRADFSY